MHAAKRLHEQGVRQVAIAKALGCSQGTVSNWIRSEVPPLVESCTAQVNHLVASLESFEQP